MTAEQFLADLEVKAKAIFSADQGECTLVEAQAILEDFSMAANPAAVLRLVGMARNAITQSDLSSEIPPLRIRREYDEMRELNCPWCGGSGHVGDCDEADQAVKRQLEQLEKEADWLATHLANALVDPCRVIHLQDLFKPLYLPTREMLRAAARKACEEQK